MKILALSDIHGGHKVMASVAKAEYPCDAIVMAGDLTTLGSRREAEEAMRGLQAPGATVLAVAGNMDRRELDDLFGELGVSINARGILVGKAGFFGVSGAPYSPLNTPYEISEQEIGLRARKGWKDIQGAQWKIFVPHTPPFGTSLDRLSSGEHVGSRAVRETIEEFQPDVTVCGHIHEAVGTDRIGKTVIVNCGAGGRGHYAVINLDNAVTVENKKWGG